MSAWLSGAWALLMLALFLHGHPFGLFAPYVYAEGYFSWGGFLSFWGGRAVALAALGAWLVFLAEWGRGAGRWLTGAGARRRLSAVAGAGMGIGFGILGTAVLALGLAGLLYPSVLLVVALVPAVLFQGWRNVRLPAIRLERKSIPWLALVLVTVVFALPLALTPEGSWDAMVYHLQFPSFFLMEHKRFVIPDSPFVGYPGLMEMHYILALGLGGSEQVAKFQHGACWILAGSTLYSVASRFGRIAGWGSLMVWMGSAMGMQLAGLSYVDHAVAWMAALCAGFIGFIPRSILLAGLFAGWCTSAKYTGGFAVVGLLAALLRPGSLRLLFPAFAGMAVAGAPWPAVNFLELGNPLYPFMTRIFGGISSPAVDYWRSSPLGEAPAKTGWISAFWNRIAHDDGGVGTRFSPLWCAVILPALLAGPVYRPRLIFFGVALAMWSALPLTSRFLLPFIPAGLMAVAPAWSSRRMALVLAVAVLAFLPVSLYDKARASVSQYNSLIGGSGMMTGAEYLKHGLDPTPEYWEGAMELNRSVPPQARVLLVSGIKSYYIKRRAMVSHQHLDPLPLFRLAHSVPTAERLAIRLRQLGVSHILYLARVVDNEQYTAFPWMGSADYSRYVEWWREWTRYEFRRGEFLVYSAGRLREPRKLGRVPVLEQEVMRGISRGDWGATRSAMDRLGKLAPGSSSYLMVRGVSLLIGGGDDHAGAMDFLARAVQSPEASPDSWRALGYVMTRRGNQARAGECFLQAISLNPEDAEAHFNLGLVYMRMGRMEPGIMELRKALAIDPGREEFQRGLAQAEERLRSGTSSRP